MSTDCPLQKHKNKLCCPGSAREIDFCSSLLNGRIHLYVGGEERSTTGPFVLPCPKSFRSIRPLQFILSTLLPPTLKRGQERQAKPSLLRAPNSRADSVARARICMCVCGCVRKYHVSPQPPPPSPPSPSLHRGLM